MQPCPSRCTALRLMGQALRFAARPLGSHKGRLCLAPRPTARAAALPLHFNCARAARQHGDLFRRCAQGGVVPPPTPVSHSRGFSPAGLRSALGAPRPHPLAGRISRLHTRDRCAGARHAVRNPCYTPKGLPKINSANLYITCVNRSQFATTSCSMRKTAAVNFLS